MLGATFGKPTFATWRTVAHILDGSPLTTDELALFAQLTGRNDPPTGPVEEAYLICGRRSGKSLFSAAIALHACMGSYADRLGPGEYAIARLTGAGMRHGQHLLASCRGFVAESPILRAALTADTNDTLEFGEFRTRLLACSNDHRLSRGSSDCADIPDELAHFRHDSDSQLSAAEYVRAVRPALATLRGRLIGLSSPHRKNGHVWDVFRQYYGQPGARVLVFRGDTRTFNPSIDAELIERAHAEDPQAARAEWDGFFRDDLAGYLDDELIDRAVMTGVREQAPLAELHGGQPSYFAGVDVSGGRNDSTVVAISYRDGARVVVAAVRIWRAPHDPQRVARELAEFVKPYGVTMLRGDRYGGAWPSSVFASNGLTYLPLEIDKSRVYCETLPLWTTGRISVPDHPQLIHELRGLERRTTATGDRVDHAPGAHDDAANGCAIAAWLASRAAASTEQTVFAQPSTVWDGFGAHGIEAPFLSIFERTAKY